jgi:sugar (pentulose or hexulose) kinase
VGGGTRNLPWLQATSDLTGLDQTLCRVTTGAAYGDAFLAAQAVGAVWAAFRRLPDGFARRAVIGLGLAVGQLLQALLL